jgi:hypothetical protein
VNLVRAQKQPDVLRPFDLSEVTEMTATCASQKLEGHVR